MKILAKGFNLIQNWVSKKVADTGAQYTAYGIFGLFNFPLYYLVWLYFSPQSYENLPLRLICAGLCLVLALHQKWPLRLQKYLPLYWYFTLLFTLPCFFTFMLLANHGSGMWVTNTIVIVFFMLLLVDWISAIILLTLGSILGVITAFSYMALSFPESFDYLGFFITYFIAIIIGTIFTHNKQVLEKIKRCSIEAEANSKAKLEFIANVSHDIRTPLTGMIGMVQSQLNITDDMRHHLLKGDLARDELLSELRVIEKKLTNDSTLLKSSADELLQLCNEILEVARLESNNPSELVESFNLYQVVDHNIRLLKPVARDKRLQCYYKIDESVPAMLEGFRPYFDRILLNLVSNALKFTNQGYVKLEISLCQPVTPSLDPDIVTIHLLVCDSGIGIPEEKFDTIFENFSRLSPAYKGLYKGAGLGLYMVKRYIDAMHGSIRVDSKIGEGTCFHVILPFKVSTPCLAEKAQYPQQRHMNADLSAAKKKKSRLLIVEDNEIAAKAVAVNLNQYECQIDFALNGREAIRMVEMQHYDLVLMDISLPDISGIDVTKCLRASDDQRIASITIIGLTGHAGDMEKQQQAIAAGIQEVLSKPASPQALATIFNRYVLTKTTPQLSIADHVTGDSDHRSDNVIIDWPACLHKCEGDKTFVDELLNMLATELERTIDEIATYYNSKDYEKLRVELHRLRGGVCYLSLPQLEQALQDFHFAVKTKPQHVDALHRSYCHLQRAIALFLSEMREMK